ncbi:MAG: hypothetical protein WCP96_04930 [Methylococcaceae bacterium]
MNNDCLADVLTESTGQQLWQEIETFEENKQMQYVTTLGDGLPRGIALKFFVLPSATLRTGFVFFVDEMIFQDYQVHFFLRKIQAQPGRCSHNLVSIRRINLLVIRFLSCLGLQSKKILSPITLFTLFATVTINSQALRCLTNPSKPLQLSL